jgi:DNA cross-link repair 1A protein
LKLVKGSNVNLQIYAVPYSEHSSFFELTCFALSLDWGKMIATVNVGSEKSRTKMNKWFEKWDKARGKGNIDVVEHRCVDYW